MLCINETAVAACSLYTSPCVSHIYTRMRAWGVGVAGSRIIPLDTSDDSDASTDSTQSPAHTCQEKGNLERQEERFSRVSLAICGSSCPADPGWLAAVPCQLYWSGILQSPIEPAGGSTLPALRCPHYPLCCAIRDPEACRLMIHSGQGIGHMVMVVSSEA